MRVVIVTTSFPTAVDDAAGHFVQAHARELSGRDEVHVLAPGRQLSTRHEARGSLQVHWCAGGSLFGWPGALARLRERPWRVWGAAAFAISVRRELRRLRPYDCAVAHWMVPCAWPLLADENAPLEVFSHGADVRLLLTMPFRARAAIVQAIARAGSRLHFAAASYRRALLEALPPSVANALELRSDVREPTLWLPADEALRSRAQAFRRSLELAPGEPLVVAAGRLVRRKEIRLGLEAMALLEPPARLVVVGDGPERVSLERTAAELGVRVHFLGQLGRSDAIGWLSAADVVLHPSAEDAAPSVVREARALGRPVVACSAGDVGLWACHDPQIVLADRTAAAVSAALGAVLGARDPNSAASLALPRPSAPKGGAGRGSRRPRG